MIFSRKKITVTIKLYSGIDREAGLAGYDPDAGLRMTLNSGTRLRSVLRDLGLRKLSSFVYFRTGERMGLWSALKDGDEISCLRPSGGG